MTDAGPRSYYDRVNPDLLAAIPPAAARVLEVGCGTGALGVEFMRGRAQVRYFGIEMNEQAAAVARTRLAAVACCDIEVEWNPHGLAGASLDALVFGDVLEHLRDPWTTLAKLAGLLRDGGTLVACIPNVGHWSIVAGLLAGRFDYADEGLLDRTHLRFFTQRSILDLVRRAGLTPVTLGARRLAAMNRGLDGFLEAAAPLSRLLGIAPAALQRDLSAFQYVVTAVKGAAPVAATGPAATRGSSTGSGPSRPA
jgi:SAM-dependent methyltransferase